MRILAWCFFAVGLSIALVCWLGRGVAPTAVPKITTSSVPDAEAQLEGPERESEATVLRGAQPTAPPPAERQQQETPPLTSEQVAVREEWEHQRAEDRSLVTAGLRSADEADTNRLVGLRDRLQCGELPEQEFHRARAEIYARKYRRREAAYAAGHLREDELREALLDLAEATAAAKANPAQYEAAWEEQLAWLQDTTQRAVAEGTLRESAARERVGRFLRRYPWPPGVAEEAESRFAPYLTPRWGWIDAVDRGEAGVRRVRVVFGGPTRLQLGRERDLWRGDRLVGTARVEEIEGDGRYVVADMVSHVPWTEPRVGDVTTSD